MKLYFQRSDALIEAGHSEVDGEEIIVSGDVQLTYGSLREVDTSNPIAAVIRGEWFIEGRFDGITDHGPYSDVVILPDDESKAEGESRGDCYDCGERALFCCPDMYGPNHELDAANLVCGIHAANHVAFDGERIVPLFFDDTDHGPDGPPKEWVRVQTAYPLIGSNSNRSQCQNCRKVWPDDELDNIDNIPHIHERVAPGEPMPSGECPECGALCQPYKENN